MSTWHDGILQDDWRQHEGELGKLDWSGTTVAMLCLGDQYGYPRTFADALGIVWDAIEPKGASLIGQWDPATDPAGYDFRSSRGLRAGRFLGLVVDEDNQSSATEQRLALWCKQLRRELATSA
jgi:flavodoxin I